MTHASAAYILALDLGTTGNRALLFDREGRVVSQAYREMTQYYPQPGWLEHDPRAGRPPGRSQRRDPGLPLLAPARLPRPQPVARMSDALAPRSGNGTRMNTDLTRI